MLATAPSDEHVRAVAKEILSRSPYADYRWSLRWLLEWLWSLGSRNPAVFWAVMLLFFLVGVAVCVHLASSLRATLSYGSPTEPASLPIGERPWLAEAETLAGECRFLEAARHLQLGVLDLLLRSGTIDLQRADTNQTLRRRLAEARLAQAERGELDVLIGRLERAWFRDRPEDPTLYACWRAFFGRLDAELEHT